MKIYSVFLHSASIAPPNKAIEFVFAADDWFRLMDGRMYLVASEAGVEDLFDRIRKVVPDEILLAVVETDEAKGFAGWLPSSAWAWLGKYFPRLSIG